VRKSSLLLLVGQLYSSLNGSTVVQQRLHARTLKIIRARLRIACQLRRAPSKQAARRKDQAKEEEEAPKHRKAKAKGEFGAAIRHSSVLQ